MCCQVPPVLEESAVPRFLKHFVKGESESSMAAGYCFFMLGLRLILDVFLSGFTHPVSWYIGRKRYLSPFFEPHIEGKAQ